MRLVLLKAQKFANQAGYYLLNGRWHKTSQDKPAPKGAPVSAHPHAAGKPVQKETLADHEWQQLQLPAENVNAKTFNKQLDQLKAAAAAGDITGILGSGYGTNTYGKKLAIIANHVLGLLGSDHKVTPGQKAGTHAAVQTAPEIEAEAPAPKPEPKPEPAAEVKPEPKPEPKAEAKPVAPEKKADAELAVPEFAEGKQAKGVKAHYEKVAKKIIRAAKAGDLSALQFMPKPDQTSWKGKTDNSKKLLELHQAAIAHVQASKPDGKDVQHPDAEKQAAQEAKELAKEQVTPEKKPEPKPAKAEEPKFTDKGTLANPSGYGKTFANLKQANAAAEKLKAQGHDVYVTAQHPYQVKLNKPQAKPESQPAAETGPKEGETKQGADGTLVFKNGRWHKQDEAQKAEQKPAAKEQPKSDAAGKLAQIPWDGLLLPDSNKNAKSHNKQVAKIKAMAEAGDIEGLKNFKAGTNTYGKKQNLLAQTALAALEESAPAPKAEEKPAEKPIPPLPKFKTLKELNDWSDTPAFKEWYEAGIAKYGSKEAWHKSPESKELDDLHSELLSHSDKPAPSAKKEPVPTQDANGKPQKPTGLTSVHWSSTVNEIEAAMQAGNEPYLMTMVQQTAGLASSEAKSVHEYAIGALGYVQDQKQDTGLPPKPAHADKWTDTVNALEGWAKSGNLVEAENMYYDLYSLVDEMPDAMPVLHYAQDIVAHIKKNNPEQDSSASTDNDGPKEGETKQGANGMLVFHNGRWHKQGDKKAAEKPAPAGPADVEIPTFNHPVAKNNALLTKAAEYLKEKAIEGGPQGLKSWLTNHKDGTVTIYVPGVVTIKKASIGSSTEAIASIAKFVDELKASVGKAKKAKPAKATQAPAPAAEPEQPKQLESMDGWTQTGGQGGSNPGGKFKDENGVEWYCKFPANDHIAKAEVLAAKLYSALGLNAQDAKLVTKNGKVGIASRWVNVKKASPKELAQTPGVLEGFAADAWLANWDAVGLAFDNLQVDDQGHAMRVDAGGSLMYRAQGSKKAFGEHVTELDSLRDPKINPQAAAVFGQMSEADITASVAKVAQISDAQIRIIVNNFGPGDKAERKALAETLIARKNDLIAKYPKSVKVKKKRLDPENLPVKEDRLPKAHDFANWNGPGAGLSSKAHVNAANHKVESEMLAIAKSGNLTALKEFKFRPVSVATGEPFGEAKPISEHPSKHVQQFHQDLIQALDEIANPPQPLKIFQESDLNTLDELDMAFPSKKFGTTVTAVQSNEKMGFWVVLGGVHKAAEKFMPKKISHFTTQAIDAAYQKFKEGSKLAKHFVHSVQASGSYNDLFREGKETDHSGNKLSDVAKAAMEFATEQPEGTTVYRWQHMTKDMMDKIMSAPDGTVFQATGPMCTSMSPTATSHFGPHRITIRYAKGAKAVESFGSGKFAGEKEVTTLPNSRFVILKKEMVSAGGGKRMELEVLMLPPDLGL